jgi:hypothetical protein
MDQRKQCTPGKKEKAVRQKERKATHTGIKEKKHRVKARNEDQPREGSYYVDKPNPLGLGFWVMM